MQIDMNRCKCLRKDAIISYWSDLGFWPIIAILIMIIVVGITYGRFWPVFVSVILIVGIVQNISLILVCSNKVVKKSMFYSICIKLTEINSATIHYGHRSKPRIRLWYKDSKKSVKIYRPSLSSDRKKIANVLEANNIDLPIEIDNWLK